MEITVLVIVSFVISVLVVIVMVRMCALASCSRCASCPARCCGLDPPPFCSSYGPACETCCRLLCDGDESDTEEILARDSDSDVRGQEQGDDDYDDNDGDDDSNMAETGTEEEDTEDDGSSNYEIVHHRGGTTEGDESGERGAYNVVAMGGDCEDTDASDDEEEAMNDKYKEEVDYLPGSLQRHAIVEIEDDDLEDQSNKIEESLL